MGKIILASSSPRRSQIMKDHGYNFEVIPSPYKEKHTTTVFSYDYIENLAYDKAKSVLHLIYEPSLVIGADTVVVMDNQILGKPKNKQTAFSMLKLLSNRKHFVVTSIAVINTITDEVKINSTTSYLKFAKLTDEMINNYIDEFKPFDKAGAYGIQELPDGFVESVEGDIENIIGLSSKSLAKLLK